MFSNQINLYVFSVTINIVDFLIKISPIEDRYRHLLLIYIYMLMIGFLFI